MSPHQPLPLISIELQGLRQSLHHSLGLCMQEFNDIMQAEVDRVVTPENLQRMIREVAGPAVEAAVQSAVKSYFSYGAGHRAVQAAVDEVVHQQMQKLEEQNAG